MIREAVDNTCGKISHMILIEWEVFENTCLSLSGKS